MFEFLKKYWDIDEKILSLAEDVDKEIQKEFLRIDEICSCNNAKVLNSFITNCITSQHLLGTTGYGYNDIGRSKIDNVFADIFCTEDALVRHNFVSGTHTISTALFGISKPGTHIVSVTGKPYDTLQHIMKDFQDYNIFFDYVPLNSDLKFELGKFEKVNIVYIQRSKGYEFRNALSVAGVNSIIQNVKEINRNIVTVVDNCYGEFVEKDDINADLIIGSLIKNPGGGIARTGGYICGRADLIEKCAKRLTLNRDVGCTLDVNREILLGVYNSPNVVANALKIGTFTSRFYKKIGFETTDIGGDIVVAIKLGSKELLENFCLGIQKFSPVDSHLTPIPWEMPGYDCDVIMAAGAFTNGSSIELSADAPLREPFIVYLQGGTNYTNGIIAVLNTTNMLLQKGLIKL
ncbi:MAG: methionine gamma-lyase family protein [Oscillospiraceae bacterium]|jgi:cystathionine beta-lyase family protein involved in aluminum resistance|nr:methionine gamma-lyase family protein [Oscillospiraceae bacterium]